MSRQFDVEPQRQYPRHFAPNQNTQQFQTNQFMQGEYYTQQPQAPTQNNYYSQYPHQNLHQNYYTQQVKPTNNIKHHESFKVLPYLKQINYDAPVIHQLTPQNLNVRRDKDKGLNLNTQDIPGAQPRKTLKVTGVKRENFFPELPEIENLLTKDKKLRGATRLVDEDHITQSNKNQFQSKSLIQKGNSDATDYTQNHKQKAFQNLGHFDQVYNKRIDFAAIAAAEHASASKYQPPKVLNGYDVTEIRKSQSDAVLLHPQQPQFNYSNYTPKPAQNSGYGQNANLPPLPYNPARIGRSAYNPEYRKDIVRIQQSYEEAQRQQQLAQIEKNLLNQKINYKYYSQPTQEQLPTKPTYKWQE